MRFDWDDTKSQLLKKTRGYELKEVINIFSGHYVERIKSDDPEQLIAIGYLGNTLLSIIYEIRYDEQGEYIWLITYWQSTKREREFMNKISIEELEQKIESGEEVIDTHFDPNSNRVGKIHETVERRQQSFEKSLQLPESMLQEINLIAKELNIGNEAVIKMMLRRSLDEHYLAKTKVTMP